MVKYIGILALIGISASPVALALEKESHVPFFIASVMQLPEK